MPSFHLIAKNHHSGKRLDMFVIDACAQTQNTLTRSEVAQAIETGSILLNQAPSKPSYRLKTGDIITGNLPEIAPGTPTPNPELAIPIIFENEHFLIIDKPAGIQVHPSASEKTQTVANWLIAKYPTLANVGENPLRPGIVHRLDKQTSGLMVIAKTKETFTGLKHLFAGRHVSKTYLALVHGHIQPVKGTIDTPIARSASLTKQSVATSSTRTRGMIRSARTEYRVIESFDQYDLVEAKPKTGRTHQIRVHLASIGHSVVGDQLYGTKTTRTQDKSFSRHLLHAHKLSFSLFQQEYSFESPLPEAFMHLHS